MANSCRPGISRAGRPRLEAPSCVRTAALWAPEQSFSRVGPAVQPWSLPAATPTNAEVPNDVQGPRGAEPPRRSGHVVSLTIKDDRRVLLLARSPSRWWRGTFLAWREGAAIWLFSRDRVSEKAARAARARAGSFRYSLNVGKP
eukprot:scaffold52637_cov37-Phaeocystis_antarctica.AAC.1